MLDTVEPSTWRCEQDSKSNGLFPQGFESCSQRHVEKSRCQDKHSVLQQTE